MQNQPIQPTHIPSTWTRVCGIEILAGKFSAIWGAYCRSTDIVTLYDEYQAPLGALPIHARAIATRGKWIPALFDLDVEGAQARPGRLAMAQQLAEMGIEIADVPSEVAASNIEDRVLTGRLKLWATLQAWPTEYSNYRRDEAGKLPVGFSLIRAAGLVVVHGLSVAISENRHAAADEDYEPPESPSATGY